MADREAMTPSGSRRNGYRRERLAVLPRGLFLGGGLCCLLLVLGALSDGRPLPARPAIAGESRQLPSPRPVAKSQCHGTGTVYRLLPDDTKGTPHQRFLLRLPGGRSLLIVHNTRLAPRIDGLRVSDIVEYCGDFEPNDKGGLVHWTHRDPAGHHPGGWLLHRGRYYE